VIVEYSPESGLCLLEAFDFRRFKLVLKGELEVGSAASKWINLVDNDNALIPIQLVPALPGRPKERTWESAYAKMVASAREHGWIDARTNAIRVHIERKF
jgi:hypothetical protein